MKRALSNAEGIKSHKVDRKTNIITVVISDAAKMDKDKLIKLLKDKAGITAVEAK